MQNAGGRLVSELKAHVLRAMEGIPECEPSGKGVTSGDVQNAAGLGLNLPTHGGYVTWSVLVSLREDRKVENPTDRRPLHWRLTSVV